MSVAEATLTPATAPNPARPMRLSRAFGTLRDLLVGTFLCLSPLTSILALGWIIRRMQLSVQRRQGVAGITPGWVLGERGSGWLTRLIGGLAANIRVGLSGALSLGLASLLFTLPWLLAWWAGWDNSFNKGYEQAWAGPALFFAGIGAYLFVMLHLPMALAHQAATGRWLALFEWRAVRRVVARTGWRHVLFAFMSVFFALPLFAARGLPVFVEDTIPGFANFTPEQVGNVAGIAGLAVAAYVFASLWWLRSWSARIYADADARDAAPNLIFRTLRNGALATIWFGLVVLIVVAQFLHHSWWAWQTHPAFLLPWYG